MTEKRVERRLAAILAADVAGYSRLTGTDEEGTVSRLRALRHELIDPLVAAHGGRIVKHTGDGRLIEFASVVDAVRCALAVQSGMTARNANVAPDTRIEFRVGIHLGDVMVESDGDLMGDGVNIAARLEGIAEPGGICISEDAWRQVRDKVVAAFADLGEQSLKNISRPVRAYRVDAAGTGETVGGRSAPAAPASPSAPRLSIVVLPFTNIGGDPEQDYFVDGVTESLTTDLSRIAGAFVIGRNTAFTYKGKATDLKQIGRELNVRYVLEGSVQRGGNRMRVNVQLIDTETGNHLWAERFDKPVGDLFDMQDEIVARLANQLRAELIAIEASRSAHSSNPNSIDLYFQGMAWYQKAVSRQNTTKARDCFECALTLDPDNVDALAGLGVCESIFGSALARADHVERLAASEAAAMKALSLAPNHAFAHFVLATVYVWTDRASQALDEFERALEIDRNFAFAHSYAGLAKAILGRAEETEASVLEALRLSPRDALAYVWMSHAGSAKLRLGAHEEALAWLRRSVEVNRNYSLARFLLAAALAHLGRMDEARSEVQAGLALDPTFAVRHWRARSGGNNPIFRAQTDHVAEGMRKAGIPEG